MISNIRRHIDPKQMEWHSFIGLGSGGCSLRWLFLMLGLAPLGLEVGLLDCRRGSRSGSLGCISVLCAGFMRERVISSEPMRLNVP